LKDKPLIIVNILTDISYWSHLIPLLVFIIFYKRNKLIWVKVLLFYIAISFINDNFLLIFEKPVYDRLTFIFLSVYTIVEYSIFAFFLYSVIDNKVFKNVILTLTIGFFTFALIIFFASKRSTFDSLSASSESILIIIYCIFYLFDQLNKPQVVFIYEDQNFWFVAGFMVYLSASFFLFVEANSLIKELRDIYWKIFLVANITKNILFAIAFSRKNRKSIDLSYEPPFDDNILENSYKT